MGWTFTHKPRGQSIEGFFKEEFAWKDHPGAGVIDCVVVKFRTAYLAVRLPSGRVIAVVCLLQYRPGDYYNFGYKDIDETMGPGPAECPERILKLLTPLEEHEKYAREWRERCWARINARRTRPKLTDGCVIKLKHPVKFANGDELDTFRVHVCGRRVRFTDSNSFRDSFVYRLSDIKEYDYELVKEDSHAPSAT